MLIKYHIIKYCQLIYALRHVQQGMSECRFKEIENLLKLLQLDQAFSNAIAISTTA